VPFTHIFHTMLLNVFSTGLYTSVFIHSFFFVLSLLSRFFLHKILLKKPQFRYINLKSKKRKGSRIKRRIFFVEKEVGAWIFGSEAVGIFIIGTEVVVKEGVDVEVVGREDAATDVVDPVEFADGVMEVSFENCLKYSAPVRHDSLCSLDKLAALQ